MAEGDSHRHRDRFGGVAAFLNDLAFEQIPKDVVLQATRCLLDLVGVAAAGRETQAASIVSTYAAMQLCGRERNARILFDGRKCGIAGAAFAGATVIDAVDAHDGHALTKGHAGAALLPSLLAFIDSGIAPATTGREFITCLVLGYEIATRGGIALHATARDYHCSGAWNALGCAAIGARLMALDATRARHALGIAEYLGPRGQIMRVCEEPSMLKDGSGWGAHIGVTAAMLAREHFTGAPALTIEGHDAIDWWTDLGLRWRMREQYFKPYPVCRWAQPAIEAALSIQRTHRFRADGIAAIAIETFHEAVALGSACAHPQTTEEAQYSLPYPVAAALVFGRVGADEINAPALHDPRVVRLLDRTTLSEARELSDLFPAQRFARVRITLNDGAVLTSELASARGDPDSPLSDDELRCKYRSLAQPILREARTMRIERAITTLASDDSSLALLVGELLQAVR